MCLVSGTVFDISRYAIHDGPGIRTTVFFKGCPLSCWWCHNPESISREPQVSLRPGRCIQCGKCVEVCPNHAIALTGGAAATDPSLCRLCLECAKVCCADAREVVGRTATVDEVMAEIIKDTPFYDESGGGVTFSGGEPLLQPAFLLGLLDACGRLDIHRAVDTSGYADPELLHRVAEKTDLFLYDLKHMDPDVHKKYTGVGNELILANLQSLAATHAAIHVRLPLIPGVNDDQANVEKTAAFLRQLNHVERVDILPYHDVMNSKYRRFGRLYRLGRVPPPGTAQLEEVAGVLSSLGLRVTIGGNDYERTNTQAQKSQS
jgi:pyruvate formate lyase activating enzyme